MFETSWTSEVAHGQAAPRNNLDILAFFESHLKLRSDCQTAFRCVLGTFEKVKSLRSRPETVEIVNSHEIKG